jgi:hypothetical protein
MRVCAHASWRLTSHWEPGRVPAKTKLTGNPLYFIGGQRSRVVVSTAAKPLEWTRP